MKKKCRCGIEFEQYLTTQTRCTKCLIKKQQQIEKKLWQTEKKKIKSSIKTYSQKIQEARRIFQKWIRCRDAKRACVSCGTSTSVRWDASHYYPANIYSGLIFDECNVHKSCIKCNTWQHGNIPGYREGLIKRYGLAYVLELENKSITGRNKKWTDEELNQIKTKYKIT